MKRQFYLFLKENNAWDEFKENAKLRGKKSAFKWQFPNDSTDYVSSAFYWEGTLQGHDYWEKLDDKWLELNGIL